eukprot:TRINITY_DN323_c0_g1_i1.p1 TRINITY_DN323_c0_g1~~TRINITY_DN323_c0_g1_i1.p1  ORF type:complete len:467 (-),score=99.57 TRINITY_DN323_c0_g1_i1:62-1462(-)
MPRDKARPPSPPPPQSPASPQSHKTAWFSSSDTRQISRAVMPTLLNDPSLHADAGPIFPEDHNDDATDRFLEVYAFGQKVRMVCTDDAPALWSVSIVLLRHLERVYGYEHSYNDDSNNGDAVGDACTAPAETTTAEDATCPSSDTWREHVEKQTSLDLGGLRRVMGCKRRPVILEVGAGIGLIGIALAIGIGADVILTDTGKCVDALCRNIELNHELITRRGGRCRAIGLWWGEDGFAQSRCENEEWFAAATLPTPAPPASSSSSSSSSSSTSPPPTLYMRHLLPFSQFEELCLPSLRPTSTTNVTSTSTTSATSGQFDFVITVDCAYDHVLHNPLIWTLQHVCTPNLSLLLVVFIARSFDMVFNVLLGDWRGTADACGRLLSYTESDSLDGIGLFDDDDDGDSDLERVDSSSSSPTTPSLTEAASGDELTTTKRRFQLIGVADVCPMAIPDDDIVFVVVKQLNET